MGENFDILDGLQLKCQNLTRQFFVCIKFYVMYEEVLKATKYKMKQQYVTLTSAQCFEIGKKAAEISIARALRFYKKKYPESQEYVL